MVQEIQNTFATFGNLTAKQSRMVVLVAEGKSNAAAYREAYGRSELTTKDACQRAWKVLSRPEVKEVLNKLKEQMAKQADEQAAAIEQAKIVQAAKVQVADRVVIIKKTLLTLNDRLSILAQIALSRSSKPSDKARAIEVYSKIAGDFAPQRVELTGANGEAIQTQNQTEVSGSVTMTQLSIRDRIARLRGLPINVTPAVPPPAPETIAIAPANESTNQPVS